MFLVGGLKLFQWPGRPKLSIGIITDKALVKGVKHEGMSHSCELTRKHSQWLEHGLRTSRRTTRLCKPFITFSTSMANFHPSLLYKSLLAVGETQRTSNEHVHFLEAQLIHVPKILKQSCMDVDGMAPGTTLKHQTQTLRTGILTYTSTPEINHPNVRIHMPVPNRSFPGPKRDEVSFLRSCDRLPSCKHPASTLRALTAANWPEAAGCDFPRPRKPVSEEHRNAHVELRIWLIRNGLPKSSEM